MIRATDLKMHEASIIVSYRYEVGRTMHAAFFDHYVLRAVTQRDTAAVTPPLDNKSQLQERVQQLQTFIDDPSNPHHLTMPKILTNLGTYGGLLLIQGHRRYPKPGEYYAA